MFSLAVVLFFSVTGLTLNHPDWFLEGVSRTDRAEGQVDAAWLKLDDPDPDRSVDRLRVVEHLRAAHGIGGAMVEFRVDDLECLVTFKGPGYAADAFVDRETGRYSVTQTHHGLVAVLNDLHKGRDTGPAWSLLIDVSAVAMTLISLTGLALLFYLKLRRRPGLVVGLAGTAVALLVWRTWVP